MSTLEIFDKPMCCSTGICGPEVDQDLVHFSADLQWLEKKGVKVNRINPASQPDLFASNETVREELRKSGGTCLPLILFNNQVVSSGKYLSRSQLASLAGITLLNLEPSGAAPSQCCAKPQTGDGQSSNCCS
jgi:hypothetical protein